MPKAEVGSTKHLSNKLKSKGLQRLRWYCQVCEKQCRDANGFKMHTQSESHVRQLIIVGEDPKKFINDFSAQFIRDFLQLLKTGHGEKQVHINQFYQEYIANKEHIHMNATKWPSLTEFAKHLGRESICRVEENEKGIYISWIDNSPEALRRQEAIRKKEAQEKGDEQLEQRIIREQIRRAHAHALNREADEHSDEEVKNLKRQSGEKIKLSFGPSQKSGISAAKLTNSTTEDSSATNQQATAERRNQSSNALGIFGGFSTKTASKPQTKNVFAEAKNNAVAAGQPKKHAVVEQPQRMSEVERIMKEEMERKRPRSKDVGKAAVKRHKTERY